MLEARKVRPVGEQPAGSFTQHTDRFVINNDDMDSNTVRESDLSLKSRSFLHRVNDRVRKMLDQSSEDATQRQQQTFFNIENVYVFNIGSICIHGKELLRRDLHSIKNTGKDLTMKQMFDISQKLIVGQSDDIYGVLQLTRKILHGNNYLWSVMKQSSVSRTRRFPYFQNLCYALERWIRTQNHIFAWEEKLTWFKSSSQHRTLDTIDGEPMEFELNIFTGFTTLQLCTKSPRVHVQNERSIGI